jgi:hypothetical protein
MRDDHQGHDASRRRWRAGDKLHYSDPKRPAGGHDPGIGDPFQGVELASDPMHEGMLSARIEIIPSSAESMAAGNVIFGGIIGLGVDAASGAMNKYPDVVTVAMTPDPACRTPEPPPPNRAPPRHISAR